jgi:esterase
VVPLFHRDLGGAGHPPLILLHGLLGSSRNWQTTGTDLADRFHVFALDLRNHGRSPHDPVMTYSAMMDDVTGWMDAQAIPRASLLGHSMGGKVAMLLACRQPQRVERLIVVDIAPKSYLSAAHRAEFAAMNELNLAMLRSRAEAEMRFEARIPDWAMRKFLTTNLEREEGGAGEWQWIVNLPVLTSSLAELEKTPLIPEDVFAGPTHFITGGKSRYVQPDDRKAIEAHFPGARVDIISTSGHNPHMEARPEFVAAVIKAL